jgi:hypothetical protein
MMRVMWIGWLHYRNAAVAAVVVVVLVGVSGAMTLGLVPGMGLQLYRVIQCLLKVMKRTGREEMTSSVAKRLLLSLVREVQCPPGVLTGSAVTAAETAVTSISRNIMTITAMVIGPPACFPGPVKAVMVAVLKTVIMMRVMWIGRLHHRNAAVAAVVVGLVAVSGAMTLGLVPGMGLQLYRVIQCLLKVMKRKDRQSLCPNIAVAMMRFLRIWWLQRRYAAAPAAVAVALVVVALSVQSRPPQSRLQKRKGKIGEKIMLVVAMTMTMTTLKTIILEVMAAAAPALAALAAATVVVVVTSDSGSDLYPRMFK